MICMCLAGQGLAGGGWWGEQGLKCPLTYNQCEVVVCAGKSRGKLWHRLERTKSSGKPEQQNEGMKGVAICLERRECQRLREWMKWKSTVPVKSLQMTLNDGGWTKGLIRLSRPKLTSLGFTGPLVWNLNRTITTCCDLRAKMASFLEEWMGLPIA